MENFRIRGGQLFLPDGVLDTACSRTHERSSEGIQPNIRQLVKEKQKFDAERTQRDRLALKPHKQTIQDHKRKMKMNKGMQR
jgi:hypothetical protein